MRICLDHAYTAKELAAICGGKCTESEISVRYLTTDSREIKAGDLFFALHGNRDGNHFLADAAARGAALALCERREAPLPAVTVPDTERALTALASHVREQIDPTVIAVTGSTGKTTTKNMIASVLETRFTTHKTPGNYNNLLGVCLTLLSMPRDTEILVLELGMNHAGEIQELSCLVRPDIAVITNIGTAHIGNLGSRENIAAAKLEILQGCAPDALFLRPCGEPLLHVPKDRAITEMEIGKEKTCVCHFENLFLRRAETVADYFFDTRYFPALYVAGVGEHIAMCGAFALAVGCILGINEEGIRKGLRATGTEKMRQEILTRHGITVILDCYNASPESVRAALHTLQEMDTSSSHRKCALLGDMLELGDQTRKLHEAAGEACVAAGVTQLFTFGAAAENIAAGAERCGMKKEAIHHNPNPAAPEISAGQLSEYLQPGDILLIKASRALAAERILMYWADGHAAGEE